ncbi:hypothetical protein HEK616_35790 [Streptomyces nigrescens]|uniref:Uncharacterized protein n=1 Tax=Streptomyces nigrescens TaxID=1920 RepID=A0ABM7ZUP9_STRNI|nr:hypothetical protein HEK616_35790 [Streptomyces nigrescens]
MTGRQGEGGQRLKIKLKYPVVIIQMNNGRTAGTDRRRQRVKEAIATADRDGTPLTAPAIARHPLGAGRRAAFEEILAAQLAHIEARIP